MSQSPSDTIGNCAVSVDDDNQSDAALLTDNSERLLVSSPWHNGFLHNHNLLRGQKKLLVAPWCEARGLGNGRLGGDDKIYFDMVGSTDLITHLRYEARQLAKQRRKSILAYQPCHHGDTVR